MCCRSRSHRVRHNLATEQQQYVIVKGFLGGASGKEHPYQCRSCKRMSSIPGWGRSLGGGHGNSLWYSCLENPMDWEAWWAIQSIGSQRVSQTWLSTHAYFVVYLNLSGRYRYVFKAQIISIENRRLDLKILKWRDFLSLSGPVAKTPCSQWRVPGFRPWTGN